MKIYNDIVNQVSNTQKRCTLDVMTPATKKGTSLFGSVFSQRVQC